MKENNSLLIITALIIFIMAISAALSAWAKPDILERRIDNLEIQFQTGSYMQGMRE